MTVLTDAIAEIAGRAITRYSVAASRPSRTLVENRHLFPVEQAIFIGWHRANLLTLGLLSVYESRNYCSFVPPGVIGAAMRGMLEAAGNIEVITLSEQETGSVRAALRFMSSSLNQGKDVMVAADGPSGPDRVMRPGALWLARETGFPIVPVGYAARPALHLPRWDRLIVPVPGARMATSVGEPISIAPHQRVNAALLRSVQDRLNDVTERAYRLVRKRAVIPGVSLGQETGND
jgi:lysophospholipid acyltransferase (LPLAT)-like uncharacterized protein